MTMILRWCRRSLCCCLTAIAACHLGVSTVFGVMFNDGGTHVIDYAIDDGVGVSGNGLSATLIQLLPGGSIHGNLGTGEDGGAIIDGGIVMGNVSARGDGGITMMRGAIEGNATAGDDAGTISLQGGSIGGDLVVDGGDFRIIGWDFRFNGSPVGPGELTLIEGMLSGTLADGTALANRLVVASPHGSSVTLQTVPAPSSGLLAAIGISLLVCSRFKNTLVRDRRSAHAPDR